MNYKSEFVLFFFVVSVLLCHISYAIAKPVFLLL